ncbi:unnamed protein product [Fraxinus pennsylvanica]|uniref:Uncharacterized protein n=1 Tax=Fraxinus pennsylvanica TaxID=56036 RepID=A0AAD2DK64_9LAMI|nr:unnamed protein product [Fraxinus pennsylvanica]
MSAGGAFGGNRGVSPVPPEKGEFPLDHMHLCDLEKKDYVNCLKSSRHKSENGRYFSKKYLECCMERNFGISLAEVCHSTFVAIFPGFFCCAVVLAIASSISPSSNVACNRSQKLAQ